MPNKAAAKKYLRASQRRRMRNKPVRSYARTTMRAALEAIEDATDAAADTGADADWDQAEARIRLAVSALDRAAQKGVIHANTAARRKSRLLRRFHHARNPESPTHRRTPPPQPARVS